MKTSATRPRLVAGVVAVLMGGCNAATESPGGGQNQSASGGVSGTGGDGRGSGGTGGTKGESGSGGVVGSGGASGGGGSAPAGTGGAGTGGTTAPDAAGTGGSAGTGGAAGTDAAAPSDTGAATGTKFSFFVTSFEALKRLSKNPAGFGGNLKYGQASGLAGADKICTEIAESALPGAGAKGWRAFLSAQKGLAGTPENAIDRIGEGPWYDRKGRLLAMSKADLLFDRPRGADPMIANDLPNEHGINNSRPNPGAPAEDNHHFLTGSNRMGQVDGAHTCDSWETNETTATNPPRTGFSFVIANRRHWYYGQVEGGCGAGFDIDGSGPANPNIHHVGSGGGYGGFYCFALQP